VLKAENTQNIGIRWYDQKTESLHYLYEYDQGKRISLPPRSASESNTWLTVSKSKKPYILTYKDNIKVIPGTGNSLSGVAVPIIGSDRVIGLILLEDYERENAYDESIVRLLETVASSMGVALEDARLFEETQRLLSETEQRNAELAS
jgi:transcriptional regulator with GAF, ATPase, and Fis domain